MRQFLASPNSSKIQDWSGTAGAPPRRSRACCEPRLRTCGRATRRRSGVGSLGSEFCDRAPDAPDVRRDARPPYRRLGDGAHPLDAAEYRKSA